MNYLLKRGCKLGVFTAGKRDYANMVVTLINKIVWDGQNHFVNVLNYNDLTHVNNSSFLKDLKKFRPSANNILLVDNKPENAQY